MHPSASMVSKVSTLLKVHEMIETDTPQYGAFISNITKGQRLNKQGQSFVAAQETFKAAYEYADVVSVSMMPEFLGFKDVMRVVAVLVRTCEAMKRWDPDVWGLFTAHSIALWILIREMSDKVGGRLDDGGKNDPYYVASGYIDFQNMTCCIPIWGWQMNIAPG